MNEKNQRNDDYLVRREHLSKLSDEELKNMFWKLAEKAVSPLIELAKKNTSPSIERSVLLRMGFSSIEAKSIVDKVIDYHLMSKGAGHVVYRYSMIKNIDIRNAGLELASGNGFEEVVKSFEVKK
jgi:D-ornithine 4,5-aminomutase subunit alpha